MTTVAYLGPENTNTHVAAQAKFGKRADFVHAPTVEDVFRSVERRQADFGVVPIENSLEGAVTHTLDRFIDFIDTPVQIQGDIELPIRHSLIILNGARLLDLKIVFSHPQALAQCRHWLDQKFPGIRRMETRSTAEAVQRLLDRTDTIDADGGGKPVNSLEIAAIARAELAERGLKAIPIPEVRENKTRFLILGLGEPKKGKRNKTSVVFALKDKPGALHDALVPFKRNKINLTKIESRPSKRKAWEYVFFIDVEGHESDVSVQRALKALGSSTSIVRILGSYPVAAR